MNKYKAMIKLYPNIVVIRDDIPYDANGNEVSIDMNQVNAWTDPDQYKYDRQNKYKPIEEQLDMMYHDKVDGTSTWKEHIDAVKAAHPKPTE